MSQREKEEPILPILSTFSEAEDSSQPYSLTRRAFLDAVYNRIHVVNFYPSSLHHARIFALPHHLDRYGRVKVALAINPEFPRERQAHSLVHEMIHIDRNAWEKVKDLRIFSDELNLIKAAEEELTEKAAQTFYDEHPSLAILALNHVWLRRKELNED